MHRFDDYFWEEREKKEKELIEFLISKGADINAKTIIYRIIILLF